MGEVLRWPWNSHKLTYFKNDQCRSYNMSSGSLCVNMTKTFKRKCPKLPRRNFHELVLVGLSVSYNKKLIELINKLLNDTHGYNKL